MISVIVPVYNVGKYLNRCIFSIVNQTYSDLEIILVDDGSFDDSAIICDEWKRKDNRIKVIHKKNGGLSDARNAGLEIFSGEYVSFVDGDDAIAADMYENMYNAIISYNADVATCGKIKIYPNKEKKTQDLRITKVFSSYDAISELFYGRYIDESFCDKLFSASLMKDFRFTTGEINEDLPLIPSVLNKCNSVVHVGKCLYFYYQNTGSITRSGYSHSMSIVIQHLKKIRDEYIKTHKRPVNFLIMRYSIAMLFKLGKNKKDFIIDYTWYKHNLWNLCLSYLFSKKSTLKSKAVCLLALIRNI